MATALQINGVDATTLGLTLAEAPGWLDAPPRDVPTTQVIGRPGLKALAAPIEGPRQITLVSTTRSATSTLTRTQIDAIKLALMADTVSLIFADHGDRYVATRLKSFTVKMLQGAQGPFVQEALGVEAVLIAHDPYSYDNAVTTIASAASMALGTAPSRPVITITATGTNAGPVAVVLRTNDNVIVGTLTITVGLVITDVLVIDMDAKTIKKNGVSIIGNTLVGDFWLADPLLHIQAGVGPKVDAVTNATVSVAFRKTWR